MRMIDADALQELCNRRIQDTWNSGVAPVSRAEAYADFKDDIDSMPTLTQPNEPLPLEQLREMDGEPGWVTPLGFWALVIAKPGKRVQLISNDGETVWADKEIELVGPIYRRPPERQEDT